MFGMFGNSERRGNFSTRERERERGEDMRIGQERKKGMILYIFLVCQLGYERRKRKVERKKKFYIPLFDLHGEEKRNYNRRKII